MFVPVPSQMQQGYYTRAFEWDGLYVVSGPEVQPLSLMTAAETAFNMLRHRPDLVGLLVQDRSRVAVTPQGASIVALPEFRDLDGEFTSDGRPWNQVTGIAGYDNGYIAANGEANVLSLPNDPYRGQENITLHEWAHVIHMGAINKVASLADELTEAFNDAMAAGLWSGTYVSSNVLEYFAVATEAFFDFTREPDSTINHVNTRAELAQYDPQLFAFMVKIYGNDNWRDGDWIGGDGADVIKGLTTADLIFGLGGSDTISAGGGNDKVYGGTGNDTLDGGPGNDTLRGETGNDIYLVGSGGDRTIEAAGGGIDTVRASVNWALGTEVERLELAGIADLNGTGNSLNNTLAGNGGNNRLNGAGGNDTVNGGAGNDTINGGSGNDRLIGGPGADSFIFTTPLNAGTKVDRISDFVPAFDTLLLENAVFTALKTVGALATASFWKSTAGVAHDATDRIIYDTDSGGLSYDADGNAAGAATQFAMLAPNLAMTNTDFVVI